MLSTVVENPGTLSMPIYLSSVHMAKHLIHEVAPPALQEYREQLLFLFTAGIFSAGLISKTVFHQQSSTAKLINLERGLLSTEKQELVNNLYTVAL